MKCVQEKPHISFSQIDTYMKCPLKYRCQYIDCIPWEARSSGLALGSALHHVVAKFYCQLKNGVRESKEKMMNLFEKEWAREIKENNVKYNKKEDANSLRELGMKLVETYLESIRPQRIVAVEQSFRVPIKNPLTGETISDYDLIGSVDLLEVDSERNEVIVDLKSSGKRFSDRDVEQNLQASAYGYSSWVNNGHEDSSLVRFDVMLKNSKPELIQYYTTRGIQDYARLFLTIKNILAGIKGGVFYPESGYYCSSCQFQEACRKWSG